MMGKAQLTLSSKNYGAWSLRGWLMVKMSGLEFEEKIIPPDDPTMRADILLMSSSIRVPRLTHGAVDVWDTLAIGEYLNELRPERGLLPADAIARAHCRSVCGEMHSGFTTLRNALPVNIKAYFPGYKVWSKAREDIQRICDIWEDCLTRYGGPFLFGASPCMADAMFAPVVTRFRTYDVELPDLLNRYCQRMLDLPWMLQWVQDAKAEPDEIDELDAEF